MWQIIKNAFYSWNTLFFPLVYCFKICLISQVFKYLGVTFEFIILFNIVFLVIFLLNALFDFFFQTKTCLIFVIVFVLKLWQQIYIRNRAKIRIFFIIILFIIIKERENLIKFILYFYLIDIL